MDVLGSLLARGPPSIAPPGLQVYNSYDEDPKWQRKFTVIWTSVLAFSFMVSMPWIVRAARQRRLYAGLVIRETDARPASEKPTSPNTGAIDSVSSPSRAKRFGGAVVTAIYSIGQSVALFTLPLPNLRSWRNQVGDCCRRSYLSLSVSQIVLVAAYLAAAIACWNVGLPSLYGYSNRPGFLAIAQLPVVMLFSLKSPLPLPVFLPSLSYEHYNFIHRWAGRSVWLAATLHMSIWLHFYISTDQWDQVWQDKSKRGMVAYAMLCLIALTSVKPMRRRFYQVFWCAHVTFFVGFFFAICYHTSYARPWVYPCIAFYAYDLFVRLVRYRIKDATIVPVDDTMTMIHIPDCDDGWLPTQHVNIRVLRGPQLFEGHPLTITNAAPTALNGNPRGIILYAKVAGDWTRRLHKMAADVSLETGDDFEEREAFLDRTAETKRSYGADHPGRRVMVMIDGPYGGLKMDMSQYESAFVIAGGSGVTFPLGTIEEVLSWRQKGKGPRRLDAVWVVRDLSTVEAIAPTMARLYDMSVALEVELTYRLFLTAPSDPLPPVPAILPESTTMSPYRPVVSQLVREALPSASVTLGGDERYHGGLAVIAAGPEGLVMEARNAVAGLSISARVRAGGVAFHDEVYAL